MWCDKGFFQPRVVLSGRSTSSRRHNSRRPRSTLVRRDGAAHARARGAVDAHDRRPSLFGDRRERDPRVIVSPRARITREDARPRRGGRTTKEMRRSALFLTAVACVLALFATPAFAWDDDDDDPGQRRRRGLRGRDVRGARSSSSTRGRKRGCTRTTIAYGSGSGQQSVTGFPETTDANSYWQVLHAHGAEPCRFGTEIANGAIVRLLHINTKKWLHSHLHKSPITGNQEVERVRHARGRGYPGGLELGR